MHDNDKLNDIRDSHTVLEQSNVCLPEASEVKYPEGPKKITRYSSLRRDFAKAAFKRKYLNPKKKIKESEYKDVVEGEGREAEGDDCIVFDLVNDSDN
ncbi:uncharacterized protein RHIMIDRAFT_239461 [Rhizopus microsporus ATCC 52813]|uniref:Uncharacterized protein n=1 Tax=Rhizopus microsporus ATCC 52813 TaxID=1340429 RepID=A0A2G4SPC1_RHIZD|nr:uncharacterized protein RHIMIDRAFT_239461 [Rhizopus microsporus ATCC 52813]PHZ10638.1 hypothetical protein RHIMIDRAFT_239461 [Rhizopus microsporus ATCC 52813]